MVIRFEKVQEVCRFHSPLEDMKLVEAAVERRRDPLTGRWAVFSSALEGKGSMFFGPTDHERIQNLADATRDGCFFCPDKVESMTPRYPEDWLEGGCLRVGECFLFPNLFPIGPVHAVIAVGKQHYRPLDQFPADLLRDGFDAAVRFVRSINQAQPEVGSFTVNANYLFPAGASLVHPHFQIVGGEHPCTAVETLMHACKYFHKAQGQEYFPTLVAEEKDGERYVGAIGPVHWLTPYAPMGTNEVLAVLPDYADLTTLDGPALEGLAEGLSRVLRHYHSLDFSSFNFTLYAAPMGAGEGAFPPFLRVLCRQNVYENYRTDDYFMQKLLDEELMLTPPEQLAEQLRANWT